MSDLEPKSSKLTIGPSRPEDVEAFREFVRQALRSAGALTPELRQRLEARARELKVHPVDRDRVLEEEIRALPSAQPGGVSVVGVEIAWAPPPAHEATAAQEVQAFLQIARRLEEQNHLEAALEAYRQALELARDEPSLGSLAQEVEAVVRQMEGRVRLTVEPQAPLPLDDGKRSEVVAKLYLTHQPPHSINWKLLVYRITAYSLGFFIGLIALDFPLTGVVAGIVWLIGLLLVLVLLS